MRGVRRVRAAGRPTAGRTRPRRRTRRRPTGCRPPCRRPGSARRAARARDRNTGISTITRSRMNSRRPGRPPVDAEHRDERRPRPPATRPAVSSESDPSSHGGDQAVRPDRDQAADRHHDQVAADELAQAFRFHGHSTHCHTPSGAKAGRPAVMRAAPRVFAQVRAAVDRRLRDLGHRLGGARAVLRQDLHPVLLIAVVQDQTGADTTRATPGDRPVLLVPLRAVEVVTRPGQVDHHRRAVEDGDAVGQERRSRPA